MRDSIGLLEVGNLTTAIICGDEMMKSAYVEIQRAERIGSGRMIVMIKGELASVQEAIRKGEEIAYGKGQLLASKVIAKPYATLDSLIK